jgi:hypothetical protein
MLCQWSIVCEDSLALVCTGKATRVCRRFRVIPNEAKSVTSPRFAL